MDFTCAFTSLNTSGTRVNGLGDFQEANSVVINAFNSFSSKSPTAEKVAFEAP